MATNTTGTISGDLAKAARGEWPPCTVKAGTSSGGYSPGGLGGRYPEERYGAGDDLEEDGVETGNWIAPGVSK